ncbi:hypothetical protein C8R47DRAFT_532854 [Mycena vitilis]|nr:hypothetical protein C8R47DRAFT_532854 [Mycena vitilis]
MNKPGQVERGATQASIGTRPDSSIISPLSCSQCRIDNPVLLRLFYPFHFPSRRLPLNGLLPSFAAEELHLTVALHALAIAHGSAPLLPTTDRRGDNLRAKALGPRFPILSDQNKLVDVLQALVAICTARSGPDNVAVMLAFAPEDPTVTLLLCQNSGKPFEDISLYLKTVWELLRKLRPSSPPQSKVTPPRKADDPDLEVIEKMGSATHIFVFKKLLNRLKKKHERASLLNELAAKDPKISQDQKSLMWSYCCATGAANLVDPVEESLSKQNAWNALRTILTDLYKLSKQEKFASDVQALQNLVTPESFFDVEQSIKKAIKINISIITLADLARSPNRGWVVNCDLDVVSIPLPAATTVHIPLSRFESLCPIEETKQSFYGQVTGDEWTEDQGDEAMVSVNRKVHSECQLAAAFYNSTLRGLPIVPYIASSKLHCLFCHRWLHTFNKISGNVLGFDGTHGTIRRGWHPPTLTDSEKHGAIVDSLTSEVVSLIPPRIAGHEKETSNSSTSSFPTGSELPRPTEQRIWARDNLMRHMASVLTPPSHLALVAPETPVASASSDIQTTSQVPKSWADLAANLGAGKLMNRGSKKTTPHDHVPATPPSIPQPPAASSSRREIPDTRCYVRGVLAAVSDTVLSDALRPFGEVKSQVIDRSRNCAFVEYRDAEAARRAITAGSVWLATPPGGAVKIERRRKCDAR